jgi:hypothetical protein
MEMGRYPKSFLLGATIYDQAYAQRYSRGLWDIPFLELKAEPPVLFCNSTVIAIIHKVEFNNQLQESDGVCEFGRQLTQLILREGDVKGSHISAGTVSNEYRDGSLEKERYVTYACRENFRNE